jgi:hypothetical protein
MKHLLRALPLLFTSFAFAEDLHVPVENIQAPDVPEITLWAKSPMLQNPTNMDTDAVGRIWVAEGVNYRQGILREEGDGKADLSHTFVQDRELISPPAWKIIGPNR